MPPDREWRIRLADILEAISRVKRYTEGMSEVQFRESELVQDAIIRNFAVIGEAARHVPKEIRERHPDVPWHRMRGMRNLVVHEYFGVDPGIVWNTVWEELPALEARLEKILESE